MKIRLWWEEEEKNLFDFGEIEIENGVDLGQDLWYSNEPRGEVKSSFDIGEMRFFLSKILKKLASPNQ